MQFTLYRASQSFVTGGTSLICYSFWGIESRVLGNPLSREETDRMKKTIHSLLSVAVAAFVTVIVAVVALALPTQFPLVNSSPAAATPCRRRNRLVRSTLVAFGIWRRGHLVIEPFDIQAIAAYGHLRSCSPAEPSYRSRSNCQFESEL
jgi:hypothetical protein